MRGNMMHRRKLIYARLAELSEKSGFRMEFNGSVVYDGFLTEGERYEEQALSREFWDWAPVENFLRPDVRHVPYAPTDTPIQKRILMAAYSNSPVENTEAA